jgi:hypothetical protein
LKAVIIPSTFQNTKNVLSLVCNDVKGRENTYYQCLGRKCSEKTFGAERDVGWRKLHHVE